jgi:phosphate transport system protein
MPDKHLSSQFDSDLNNISSRLMELGGLVESQIRQAIYALAQFSAEAAEDVLHIESRVNTLEVEIDREISSIIGRRQPTARDLRLLMSMSKTAPRPIWPRACCARRSTRLQGSMCRPQ